MLAFLLLTVLGSDTRPVHTYSIVAYDAQAGQLGVAVQSHWFSVGSVVAWAESGVGAVATQSLVEVSYGPLGLAMMRAGKTPQQALDALLHTDSGAGLRQVAMVDVKGNVATHTGQRCIAEAGHQQGEAFSVQANIMAKTSVWPAMAKAFETHKGDLAQRMLAALKAAQAEGGDLRGMQSAALIVVSAEPSGQPWNDRIFDLRIDDHPSPIAELERLLEIARAYHDMDQGDAYLGQNDMPKALESYRRAMQRQPENAEMIFWTAVTLASNDRLDEALPLFDKAFEKSPALAELLPRLVPSGIFPDDESMLKRILKELN